LVVLDLSCFGSQFLLAELSDRFPEKVLFLCERKIQLLHQRVNSQDCGYLKAYRKRMEKQQSLKTNHREPLQKDGEPTFEAWLMRHTDRLLDNDC